MIEHDDDMISFVPAGLEEDNDQKVVAEET